MQTVGLKFNGMDMTTEHQYPTKVTVTTGHGELEIESSPQAGAAAIF